MRRVLKSANQPLQIPPQEKPVFICLCGLSKNQPYCDGAHARISGEEPDRLYEYDDAGQRVEITG